MSLTFAEKRVQTICPESALYRPQRSVHRPSALSELMSPGMM